MQSVSDGTKPADLDELVPASELREITATPEDLFDKKKMDMLTSLMSSMVGVATQNGSHSYAAQMTADMDTTVLDAVQQELRDLGYQVSYEPSKFKMQGQEMDIILFKINWAA